jgi:hypothetical protein
VPDDANARRLRAERLREKIARLRKGESRDPSSPRDFVDREAQRADERPDEEEESGPDDVSRD